MSETPREPLGDFVTVEGYDYRLDQPYSVKAFIPADLPNEVELSPSTVFKMSEADRALGNLNSRISFLPNPALLVRPAIITEAKATSAIEGTFATLDEILTAEYLESPRSQDVGEILNYVRAANRGLELIKDLPICLRVLCELHENLLRGARGDGYETGALRKNQVFIGSEGAPVEEARFVPVPPGEALVNGFSQWEKWVNDTHEIPLLAKVAMAHYQFETLHPFADGNGRLGRLIITLQLVAADELSYPILNLSAWLEPRKAQYVDALKSVSLTGDFNPWIQLFCDAVTARAKAAMRSIDGLFKYRDGIVERATLAKRKTIGVEVADFVIGNPVFTIEDLRKALGVSTNTAANRVAALVELNVIEEVTGYAYGRVYFAREVARLLEG